MGVEVMMDRPNSPSYLRPPTLNRTPFSPNAPLPSDVTSTSNSSTTSLHTEDDSSPRITIRESVAYSNDPQEGGGGSESSSTSSLVIAGRPMGFPWTTGDPSDTVGTVTSRGVSRSWRGVGVGLELTE